jgi:DNA-directed RNA polymerase subunit RPC12/RpoP
MEGLTPATYPVHVVARSPAAAMKQAEVMGHVARAAFCRGEKGRAKPATAVERLLGWRPAAECAHCGYLLDGLIIKDGSVSCPECGSHIKLWTRRAHSLFRREQ